jgi:polyhydroxybutyrate depolymerase
MTRQRRASPLRHSLWAAVVASVVLVPAARAQPAYEVFDGAGGRRDAPLVMVLHGGGGNGPELRRRSEFDRWARQFGVLAVYPSAEGRFWQDGRHETRRDDVGALFAIIDRLNPTRARRVFIIGHSNGGGMTMRLACAAPERLAGIAIVGTKHLPAQPCENPDAPLPALFIYGTDDDLAPHDGRARGTALRNRFLGDALSAEDTLAIWARRNRCGTDTVVRRSDPDPSDGVSLIRRDYSGCAARLSYIEIRGGGHAWPGVPVRRPMLPGRDREPEVRDVNAAEAALSFWLSRR